MSQSKSDLSSSFLLPLFFISVSLCQPPMLQTKIQRRSQSMRLILLQIKLVPLSLANGAQRRFHRGLSWRCCTVRHLEILIDFFVLFVLSITEPKKLPSVARLVLNNRAIANKVCTNPSIKFILFLTLSRYLAQVYIELWQWSGGCHFSSSGMLCMM